MTHTEARGRKVYQITDAGRAEVNRRARELDDLESDIRSWVEDMIGPGGELRTGVRGSARDLTTGLREAGPVVP